MTAVNSSASAKASRLARLNYQGSPILILDHDQPQFSKQTLSLHHGAWQHYGQLDRENRVTAANAMLNERLMPHREREPLYVDPTGWHNKRIESAVAGYSTAVISLVINLQAKITICAI